MRYLALFLLVCALNGCVTVAVPPNAPPVVIQTTSVKNECGPYVPPIRDKVPVEPIIGESDKNYVKYLEELAENLVVHVVVLRQYIDTEHARADDALERYRRSCAP
jgi:hypothetical protein